jgi:hypothetical protein
MKCVKSVFPSFLLHAVTKIRLQAALGVISAAGFGRPIPWSSDESGVPPEGHAITFNKAIHDSLGHIFVKLLTPNLLVNVLSTKIFGKPISQTQYDTWRGYVDLEKYLLEFISDARESIISTNDVKKSSGISTGALLTRMVEANINLEDGGDKKGLTDDELLSNVFVRVFSGLYTYY